MSASEDIAPEANRTEILVGYDGSAGADYAIEAAALLFPGAAARVAHVWLPGVPSHGLRARLESQAGTIDELLDLLQEEGRLEGERIAQHGVAVAARAGWRAEPLVQRGLGDPGYAFAQLSEHHAPAVVVVGARGLRGTAAVLGSVSDSTVHYSPVPVLVVPHPTVAGEYRGAGSGPIVVGYDGSSDADRAVNVARELFSGRRLIVAVVGDCDPPAEALEVVHSGGAEVVHLNRQGGMIRRGRAVADELDALAGEVSAAAVAVGSHGRSARREILLGSVAMAVLHHVRRPVLVVPRSPKGTDSP